MYELEMSDIWRDLNPNCYRYTWHRTNPFQQSRHDFFLNGDSVVSFVEDVEINCGYRSDHSIILLKLRFVKNYSEIHFGRLTLHCLKIKHIEGSKPEGSIVLDVSFEKMALES